MLRPTILPDPDALRLDGLAVEADQIVLTVRAAADEGRCPECGGVSKRVHSSYARRVADLPWQGAPARLRVRVRLCGGRSRYGGCSGSRSFMLPRCSDR